MYVPAAHVFLSCTTRTAPHRMAPRASRPAQNPSASQHNRSRHLQARLPLHHASRSPPAPRIARARCTWDRLACGVARVGAQRQGMGAGRGSGHMMRTTHMQKQVMVVLVLVAEAAVKERSRCAQGAFASYLHGLLHLIGGCCVVESADSARREDPWVYQDRGSGGRG